MGLQMDAQLERTMPLGVTQYVIVGAGYDSFAFRRPELAMKLKIFELDMPSTQEEEHRRMAKAKYLQTR